MTDAPERIWAYHAPELAEDNPGCTIIAGESSMEFSQEYIRADLVEALEAENQRLRVISLKALTVVEWVVGEGFLLPDPHCDADDLLLEMVPALGVEDSDAARDLLLDMEASHDD